MERHRWNVPAGSERRYMAISVFQDIRYVPCVSICATKKLLVSQFNAIVSFSAYPPLPETFSLERRLAQLDRMKKLDMNPIDGLCARK